MRRVNGIISKSRWQQDTVAFVVTAFRFADYGKSVSAGLLGRLIVVAASVRTSVSAAAKRMRRCPSGETVRKALHANLPASLAEQERRINDSLWQWIPKSFSKRPRTLAIDLHKRPYYGNRDQVPVRGGKKKKSSKWFWTWATVAVVEHGQRWTIAMTAVGPSDLLENVVERLLDYVEKAKIPAKMALLDREFYAGNVIAVLQDRGLSFLMPAIRRGNKQGPNGPTGTQRFFINGMTGFYEHTWKVRRNSNGREVTVRIACTSRAPNDRRVGPMVFAFGGLSARQLTWYRETYRRRFGIETSYRQLGESLALTTSKNLAVRMLLVAVALLLRNLWVWRNQQLTDTTVTLSVQLQQLALYFSNELGLILDFNATKPKCQPALNF